MLTIGQLKQIIKDLPEEIPFALLDLSTDNTNDMNYELQEDDLLIEDYYEDPEAAEEPKGKALFVVFINKLNPNSIDQD